MLSTASLTFTGTGAANAQSVTASQIGGTSFTASSPASGSGSCTGIATIFPATGTIFTVTPAGAGSCAFTITGADGQSATVSIGVTVTTLGGS